MAQQGQGKNDRFDQAFKDSFGFLRTALSGVTQWTDRQVRNTGISDGQDGMTIKIIGLSDTNTLTLDDGNGLELNAGAQCVLGLYDVIVLTYIASADRWIEISRTNN